jgi:enamine deaminase RidA (YjgF/YER057c/UK114 family)
MQRRDINAPDAPHPASPYSQAVEVLGITRTLYVSGQIPADTTGKVPDDLASQCRLAWRNVEAQLRAAGMGLDNIVKVTTILPDHASLGESRKARAEVLGDRKPASTLIIGGLASPAWKIEVEVIACA